MTLTITDEQIARIAATISHMILPVGRGTEENACVMAAINIALGNGLVDNVPACMSLVLGKWLIAIQDRMPAAMRNSAAFKALAPYAAGTGRAHEAERLAIIREHMWTVALPLAQPVADAGGYGTAWRHMCTERTEQAARAAAAAAKEQVARAAAMAAAVMATADVARAAVMAMADVADVAARAAARAAAAAMAAAAGWDILNPISLLLQLIEVTHKIAEPPVLAERAKAARAVGDMLEGGA